MVTLPEPFITLTDIYRVQRIRVFYIKKNPRPPPCLSMSVTPIQTRQETKTSAGLPGALSLCSAEVQSREKLQNRTLSHCPQPKRSTLPLPRHPRKSSACVDSSAKLRLVISSPILRKYENITRIIHCSGSPWRTTVLCRSSPLLLRSARTIREL